VAHVKQGNKHPSKLEDRSTMMVFIGYEPGSKAWRFYNPVTRRVHVSSDAVFEEDRAWSWNEDEIGDDEPFRVEYIAAGSAHPAAGDNAWPDSPLVTPEQNSLAEPSPGSARMPTRGSEPCTPPVLEAPGAVEHVTPPTNAPDLDEEADGAPLVSEHWLTYWARRLGGMHMIRSSGKSCWQQSVMSRPLLKKH
jgi:hypothetical protein